MPLLFALFAIALTGCASPGPDPDSTLEPTPTGCGRGGAFCGGQAPSGCWCDETCLTEGDCCTDATARCSQPARLRVPHLIAGYGAHPAFVDLAPGTDPETALEVVAFPEGVLSVAPQSDRVGRTMPHDGWRRSLAPLAWLRTEGIGRVTLRLQTRERPPRVLAEEEVDVTPWPDDEPTLTPCMDVGDLVVTKAAGRTLPVALAGRLEAELQPNGWLELRHPATKWRLGLGPGAKVLPRGVVHLTAPTEGAARRAPKLIVPRGCPRGEVRLDALTVSDAVDGVALAWRLTCEDGARSEGCAWLGEPGR